MINPRSLSVYQTCLFWASISSSCRKEEIFCTHRDCKDQLGEWMRRGFVNGPVLNAKVLTKSFYALKKRKVFKSTEFMSFLPRLSLPQSLPARSMPFTQACARAKKLGVFLPQHVFKQVPSTLDLKRSPNWSNLSLSHYHLLPGPF